MLTCASGKFIASYQARYIATAARARVREEDHWTVDPRYGASRGAARMIRGGGVWSAKLASASCTLAIFEGRLPYASAGWSLVNAGVARVGLLVRYCVCETKVKLIVTK